MSVRRTPQNGRDRSGHFRVKQADLEELQTDPEGVDYIRDDVKLGGAVADTGVHAADWGKRVVELEVENQENVDKLVGRSTARRRGQKRKRSGQQSGSRRPADRIGGVKRAPKKGGVPPKGTARPGVAHKSRPGKTNVMRKSRSVKP